MRKLFIAFGNLCLTIHFRSLHDWPTGLSDRYTAAVALRAVSSNPTQDNYFCDS